MSIENTYDVFSYKFELDKEFRSASGTVSKKETFFFRRKGNSDHLIELPLSPSMGFSTQEFKSLLKNDPEKLRRSKLVSNTVSWFDANTLELPTPKNQLKCDFITLGIGELIPDSFQGVIKLKADSYTFTEIAKLSHEFSKNDQLWSVDFNRSLSLQNFDDFLRSTDLLKCFCIEQPLGIGKISPLETKRAPIFLDEEMESLTTERCLNIRPRGLVLKTFRHSWEEYKKWHSFSLHHQIPYFVGAMIQTEIADALGDQLNSRAPICYNSKTTGILSKDLIKQATYLGSL